MHRYSNGNGHTWSDRSCTFCRAAIRYADILLKAGTRDAAGWRRRRTKKQKVSSGASSSSSSEAAVAVLCPNPRRPLDGRTDGRSGRRWPPDGRQKSLFVTPSQLCLFLSSSFPHSPSPPAAASSAVANVARPASVCPSVRRPSLSLHTPATRSVGRSVGRSVPKNVHAH